ncbi:MAG: S49 family peptidase [Caenispirillum bisanense]|nr:S49 family peptidase [Caenispirillum bisanense]MCA1974341.1 S49 family peptidase [Caenispirillum sp.]
MKLKFWQREHVALVRLEGVIGGRGLKWEKVRPAFDRAFGGRQPPRAVLLVVNSPGGSPMESDVIAREIRRRADEKKVPVIAFVEQVGASGGYWLACAADEIFAMSPMSIVGSIGVVSAGFGFVGLLDRLGVERRVLTQGTNKMRLDPFQPQQDKDREWLAGLQADIHAAFIAYVKGRRAGRLKGDDDTLFNGDVFLAQKGLELGLVDGVELPHAYVKQRYPQARLRVVHAPRRPLLARLLRGGTDALAEEMTEALLRARIGL